MIGNKLLLCILLAACWIGIYNPVLGQSAKPISAKINDELMGIWKLQEDTDKHNYFIVEKDDDATFSLTYMNRSGDNRGLEHFPAPYFVLNNEKFVYVPGMKYLVRLLVSEKFRITAAVVGDNTIFSLSDAEMKKRIASNMHNATFYKDTIHFRKLFTLQEKFD